IDWSQYFGYSVPNHPEFVDPNPPTTPIPVPGSIGATWTLAGGSSSYLGKPVGLQVNIPDGGSYQEFENYWLVANQGGFVHRVIKDAGFADFYFKQAGG